jgi:hypothetical protein
MTSDPNRLWRPELKGRDMPNPNENEFCINVPSPNTIRQGTDKPVNVTLKRGPQFNQDVTLNLKGEGLSVTPSTYVIKSSDKKAEAQFQVAVPAGTKIGDHRIAIQGIPATGEPESCELQVKVVAK